MFQKNYFFAGIAICFVSLILFITFRTVPVSRMWNGYQMLYVSSSELSEKDILTILEKNGIKDAVCRINQGYPLKSLLSPVQHQDSDSYLFTRNGFFTDETNTCKIFYIPGFNGSKVQKIIDELSALSNTTAGTDSSKTFPWLAPVICLIFAVLNLTFTKYKKIVLAISIFPLILVFCRPMYSVCAAACSLMCGFSFLIRIFKRKNFVKTALHSTQVLSLVLLPAILLILSSVLNAVFYVMALCCSICLVYVIEYIEEMLISRKTTFNFVYIRSAGGMPMIGKEGVNLAAITAIACLLIVLTTLMGNAVSVSQDNDPFKPSLPGPVSVSDGKLPDLENLNQWAWKTITFPYVRLEAGKNAVFEGQTVRVPDYTEVNGSIVTEEKEIFVYNSSFRNTVSKNIEELEYPAIEKVLLKQGKNVSYGYTKKTGSAYEKFGTLIVVLLTLIPVAVALYYVIGRRRNGRSV